MVEELVTKDSDTGSVLIIHEDTQDFWKFVQQVAPDGWKLEVKE